MELYEQIELQECPICGGAGLMEEDHCAAGSRGSGESSAAAVRVAEQCALPLHEFEFPESA